MFPYISFNKITIKFLSRTTVKHRLPFEDEQFMPVMYGYIIIIIAIITTTPTCTKNFPVSPYFNLLNKLLILCFLS